MRIFEDDTLYRKNEKGKYVSVGTSLQHDNLNNGLWLVREKEGNKSITSVTYLIDTLKDYELTIDDITTIEMYKDEIIQKVINSWNSSRYSLQDVVQKIVAEFIYIIKKQNK